jgi:hypothetical protein
VIAKNAHAASPIVVTNGTAGNSEDGEVTASDDARKGGVEERPKISEADGPRKMAQGEASTAKAADDTTALVWDLTALPQKS